ncbi:hypothetical protein AVEN_65234-1 [Araneus ventricosus]|uniref:Uncharacterized protein n=1 Tax=Araneus ventricosus TaxID=182803 RepID=A0A4Y2AFN5_ARAVE|nr:hypothetical protein AVEN_65234-1 [Araneus ventricosus]
MDKDIGESSCGMTRVKRFTVAIHPERRTDSEGDGQVVGSDILFANRLAPPLRDSKHIQETIQLSAAEDSLKELGKIEEDSQETKSVRYWAQRITYAFRSLTVSSKPRKNSFGSLFSSLGLLVLSSGYANNQHYSKTDRPMCTLATNCLLLSGWLLNGFLCFPPTGIHMWVRFP